MRRLRQAGVTDITVRLDKGFFSKAMLALLQELGISFVLKVPDHRWVRRALGPFRQSEKDTDLWTATGALYGARLCTVEGRRKVEGEAGADGSGALDLETYEVERVAHVLTNISAIHALTAWRE